jgi:sulfopyruvate decarboxylase subunit beta
MAPKQNERRVRVLKRIEVIEEVVKSSQYVEHGALVVSNIGYCSRELYSIRDQDNNFYMMGSMGLASSIGLGLALANQGRRDVIVLDGDGSVLMNLGTLATIANFAPRNFRLIIVDNHSHGSTGGQKSDTALRTNLATLARAAGIENVVRTSNRKKLQFLLSKGSKSPSLIVAECSHSNAEVPIISLSPVQIKKRFMNFQKAALHT